MPKEMTIQDLLLKNKDNIKSFLEYYSNNYTIDSKVFLVLPVDCIIGVAIKYFESKNIAYLVDLNNLILYYPNPQLEVNKLLANYKVSGKFTDIIEEVSISSVNLVEANVKAIEYIFNKLNTPF